MTEKEETALRETLIALTKALTNLNKTLEFLMIDIRTLTLSITETKDPSREIIIKTLFPYLFSEEIMEFDRRDKFLKSLNELSGIDSQEFP